MRPVALACFLASSLGGLAAAQTAGFKLSVVRSRDALDCPDEDRLSATVAALSREPSRLRGDVLVDLQFFRDPGGLTASLRFSGARQGQRSFSDPGPGCAALADAAALAIAILLDGRDDPASPSAPALSSSAPSAPPPPPPPAPASPPARLVLSAGATLTAGLTASPAAGAVAEASLRWPRGGLVGVGLVYLPERDFSLPPGEVGVRLGASLGRGCWSPLRLPVEAGGCLLAGAGVYLAEGRGYRENQSPSGVWAGAGLGGRLGAPSGLWEVQLAWVGAVQRHTFSIERVGTAFTPPASALFASFSAGLPIW